MALSYYTGLQDVNVAKEVIAKRPELYIQKREYSGTGEYALISTTGTSRLTPATSPSWTVDEFNSTVANNLVVLDDNNVVAVGKVVDTTATYIEFDETALVLESDGATAPTFTAGSNYSFRVYSPSSTAGNTYGPFFGLVEGAELNITDTFMKFMYSVPKQMLFKDLESREAQITGGHVNFSGTDVAKTIMGAVEYGSQTGQTSLAIGSNPDTDLYYRPTFVGEDRSNRVWAVRIREVQFEITGNQFQNAESGHFMAPFTADLIADTFYPTDANILQLVRTD
nr:hypothetical protein 13 [Legionellales bacterium]